MRNGVTANETRTHGPTNEIDSTSDGVSAAPWVHDADGNRLADDDFITTWDLEGVAVRDVGPASDDEIRSAALAVVGRALEMGYVEIGDIEDDSFAPWAGDVKEIASQLRSRWNLSSAGTPLIGAFWLRLTGKGRARGQQVLATEGQGAGDG